jgi:hypothetical protein
VTHIVKRFQNCWQITFRRCFYRRVGVDFVTSLLLPTTQIDGADIRRQAAHVMLMELSLSPPSQFERMARLAVVLARGVDIIVEINGIRQTLQGPAGDHSSSF